MAARKKPAAKKIPAKTPETSLRHLWLAGLGVVAIARRETRNAANDAVARIDALKQRAARLAGEAQDNVRGGIASVREQGEARVGQFSAEVEARLAPVLAKLGLKPKPATRSRKTTKKAAKAVRRTTTRGKKVAKRVAAKRR